MAEHAIDNREAAGSTPAPPTKTLRVYIGWDPRDALAFEVAKTSLLKHASIPVEVIALKDWELRARNLYWRDVYIAPNGQRYDCRTDRAFSTDFTYTRFLVPALEKFADTCVVFTDADVMWRADIAEMMAEADPEAAIACVKHRHEPPEVIKGTGIQGQYARKNWSSVMLLNPARCRGWTPYRVNNDSGAKLHALVGIADHEIADLTLRWNWLCGWSDPAVDPALVHFTRGTPDMPGYENEPFAEEWRGYCSRAA